MHLRTIIGVIALACMPISGLIGAFVGYEMVDLVNAKLPEKEQFDWLWWGGEKDFRLHAEYRRLYPGGRHLLKIYILAAVFFCCLLLSGWCFRFFPFESRQPPSSGSQERSLPRE